MDALIKVAGFVGVVGAVALWLLFRDAQAATLGMLGAYSCWVKQSGSNYGNPCH